MFETIVKNYPEATEVTVNGSKYQLQGNLLYLVLLSILLCPVEDICNMYVPKAARAMNACWVGAARDTEIDIAKAIVDYLYDLDTNKLTDEQLLKIADNECTRNLIKMRKYINENYHTLIIGNRYTWDEIVNECPYRFVYLKDIERIGQGDIQSAILVAVSTVEEGDNTIQWLNKNNVNWKAMRWTCGILNRGFMYSVF